MLCMFVLREIRKQQIEETASSCVRSLAVELKPVAPPIGRYVRHKTRKRDYRRKRLVE